MGLREDAIAQYEDLKERNAAKQKQERDSAISRQVANAKEAICRKFGLLSGCPELFLKEKSDQYYPECRFEIGGVPFQYVLGSSSLCVEVTCPKCEHSWLSSVSISTVDGKTDLAGLGKELSKEHYNCPVDRPETPQPPAQPPVKTVGYTIGSAEQRFLEALTELVYDAVGQHEH